MTAVALPRSYYRVVGATGLTNLADGIRMAVFPLLASTITSSAVAIAAVFAAGQAPLIVFGLWAGRLADTMDRQRLAQGSALGRMLILLALCCFVFVGATPLWLVIVAAAVLGISEVLSDNVSGTLVPMLVPEQHLERANSRIVGSQILGNELIGPALGGLLFVLGAWVPFLTNAALLGGAVLLLAALPILEPRCTEEEPLPMPAPRLLDGVRSLRTNSTLATITWTSAALAAVDAAWFALLVLFVRDDLGFGAGGFGLFLTLGAFGGLAGAATADRRPDLSLSMVTAAVFSSAAVSLLALGTFANVAVTGVALMATSAGFALWNVFVVSARQRATPIGTMGQVAGAYRTIVVSASLVGAFVGGFVSDALSIRGSLTASGVILLALTPLAVRRMKEAESTRLPST